MNNSSLPNIKFAGSIDLNNLYPERLLPDYAKFRLLNAIVKDDKGNYDFVLFDDTKTCERCGISLLIGKNGVGKSYMLRAIIDFLIEFNHYINHSQKRSYKNSRYRILSLRYILGNHEYIITRETGKFLTKIDGFFTSSSDIVLPRIIAAHFGLYDRFPIKSERYDVDIYNYVGTKAGGNFISTNNIITQMLFSLCEDRHEIVIRRIVKAFSTAGYEPKVTIRVSLKDSDNISSFDKFLIQLEKQLNTSSSFYSSLFKKVENYTLVQKKNLYMTFKKIRKNGEIVLDLNDYDSFVEKREVFSVIYLLKQLKLTSKLNYYFYRKSEERDCNSLSSGEINMLATIVSVASNIDRYPALILLDEPELNQHPNWQMGIIDQLNELFGDYTCHLIIATHSHFLVSDLPGEKSSVIQMEYGNNGLIGRLLYEDTYGWSAEQVLLEVFHTCTDRNIYLANIIGLLLDKIKNQDIDKNKVKGELDFLNVVKDNLKDIDPLKHIILSLNRAFSYQND